MTVRSDLDAKIAEMRGAGREVLATTSELLDFLADAIDRAIVPNVIPKAASADGPAAADQA